MPSAKCLRVHEHAPAPLSPPWSSRSACACLCLCVCVPGKEQGERASKVVSPRLFMIIMSRWRGIMFYYITSSLSFLCLYVVVVVVVVFVSTFFFFKLLLTSLPRVCVSRMCAHKCVDESSQESKGGRESNLIYTFSTIIFSVCVCVVLQLLSLAANSVSVCVCVLAFCIVFYLPSLSPSK